MSPHEGSMGGPQHLVVLVNGLWGWQRDWAQMKRALDAQNSDAKLLVHVSSVNVGAQTYAGIDTCGQRLAQQVLQLVNSTPSLTTISFLGHSMGGLIARYAIGLLTQPANSSSSKGNSSGDGEGVSTDSESSSSSSRCWLVAGLTPCLYISIATPHLGCSSHHPEEAHWQDRPFMRWLAVAVAAGHLGGHEHLAPLPAGAAAAAAAAEHAAESLEPCTATAAPGDASTQTPSHPVSGSTSSSTCSSSTNSSSTNSSSSRCWPWTPCRSVIQLLGCDNWRPLPETLQCSSSSSAGCGGPGIAAQVAAHPEAESSSDCIVQCQDSGAGGQLNATAAAVNSQAESGSSNSCCCGCKVPELQVAWVTAESAQATAAGADSSGSSSSISGAGGGMSAAAPVHLLDVLCRDVLVSCQKCGACRTLHFMSGLAFQQRLTYSSEGGDHLIPWCSSALLTPSQLPVRATQQVANSSSSSQQFQLPVLSFWATQPAIIEQQEQQGRWQQQEQRKQEQQQEQQQQQDKPAHTPSTATAAGQGDAASAQHAADSRQDAGSFPAAATPAVAAGSSVEGEVCAAAGAQHAAAQPTPNGQLQGRLERLQGMDWRRLHVVWPRLCLGSSHCNIQYNGPLNFVGKAVVAHVCQQIFGAS